MPIFTQMYVSFLFQLRSGPPSLIAFEMDRNFEII